MITVKAAVFIIRSPFHEIMTLDDIIEGNIMPSCSIVFRNRLFDAIPKAFDSVPFGDWPLQILCAEKGKVGYLHEVMGVYRFHSGGVWTKGGDASYDDVIRRCRWTILFYKAVDVYLKHRYHDTILKQIAYNRDMIKKNRREKAKEKLVQMFPILYRAYRSINQ